MTSFNLDSVPNIGNLSLEDRNRCGQLILNGIIWRRDGNRYTVKLTGGTGTSYAYLTETQDNRGLHILDEIQITSMAKDEIKSFRRYNDELPEQFIGIAEVVSATLVRVVGTSCAKPVLARISSFYQVNQHDLVCGYRTQVPTNLKIVFTEDADYVVEITEKSADPTTVVDSTMCYFIGLRMLSKTERERIENPSMIIDMGTHTAERYIRDVLVAIERMNEHVQREKIQNFVIKRRIAIPYFDKTSKKLNYRKLVIDLTREEADRCLRSEDDNTWKKGDELHVTHPDLATASKKHSIMVEVANIQERAHGCATVNLLFSDGSTEIIKLIDDTNHVFSSNMVSIGPMDSDHCSLAQCIETRFEVFDRNPFLKKLWCGVAPQESDYPRGYRMHRFSLDDNLEPFSVSGRPLDEFQLKAFRSALSTPGFTTIAAPPGSGKTMLISALLAALTEDLFPKRAVIASTTNAAVDNAIETTHEHFPALRIYREYSTYSMRGKEMSQEQLSVSFRHYMDRKIASLKKSSVFQQERYYGLRAALNRRFIASKNCRTRSDTLEEGLLKIEARQKANMDMKEQFLLIDGPLAMGSTTSLMTRCMHPNVTHLILDEAAMMSSVHGLALYCSLPDLTHVILLGDSKQLMPYCMLNETSFPHYMMKTGELTRLETLETTNKQKLNTVYRCHPDIVQSFLRPLYGEDLVAGTPAELRSMAVDKEMPRARSGSPFLFVHLENSNGVSGTNNKEKSVVISFLQYLNSQKDVSYEDVAIICFHKAQRNKLNAALKGCNIPIVVHTIDSFQGKEAKVVLVLTTKTAPHGGDARRALSFVSDFNRCTVGVSRAQHAMYLFGDWKGLLQAEFWGLFRKMIWDKGAMVNSRFVPIAPKFLRPPVTEELEDH